MMGLMLLSVACDQGTVLEQATAEFDKGNFREAIFILRHHFRKGGQRTPELLFLEGKALLALGIEAEADDSFAEIYSIDTTWAPVIAEVFREEALSSLDKGLQARGNRFIIRTANYARNADFGKYSSVAGKLLLERKDFEGAIFYFSRFMESHPDTAGAAEVMMDLAAAYEGKGEKIKAIDIYRRFKETYPRSRLVSTAVWKLENMLLSSGEELFSGGETDEAENVLLELSRDADNPLVKEKAYYMLARIYESRHETGKAIEFYSRIVHMNLGSSGRLVENAKERIVELEKARSR
ncbi:MAG TPA: tetratricopeptide repeat protein [Candidatus Krumholzibacterium sp.]|nr:tetratricopeptide repeat protein [Candidatus Krumholzibacterium sp.]